MLYQNSHSAGFPSQTARAALSGLVALLFFALTAKAVSEELTGATVKIDRMVVGPLDGTFAGPTFRLNSSAGEISGTFASVTDKLHAGFWNVAFYPVILSVSLDSNFYDFGTVNSMQVLMTQVPFVITNTGTGIQRYLLKGGNSGSWTVWDNRGADRMVLSALFNSLKPGISDFDLQPSNLDGLDKTSGLTGGLFAGDQTGETVFMGETRKLWVRLGMPLSSSAQGAQMFRLTITAEEQP